MSPAEAENIMRGARTMIIDLVTGWPVRELHMSPQEMVDDITALLEDADDPEVQEELERLVKPVRRNRRRRSRSRR